MNSQHCFLIGMFVTFLMSMRTLLMCIFNDVSKWQENIFSSELNLHESDKFILN